MSAGSTEGRRIERLVVEEQERLDDLYAAFRDALDERDAVTAIYELEHFREAFERHQRWEEESLFEEYERLAGDEDLRHALRHHRDHQAILQLCNEGLELLARRMLVGDCVDPDLDARLGRLDATLARHRRVEIDEVCVPLDRELSEETVRMIADELEERGRVPPPLELVHP